jgi:hypothetical protein
LGNVPRGIRADAKTTPGYAGLRWATRRMLDPLTAHLVVHCLEQLLSRLRLSCHVCFLRCAKPSAATICIGLPKKRAPTEAAFVTFVALWDLTPLWRSVRQCGAAPQRQTYRLLRYAQVRSRKSSSSDPWSAEKSRSGLLLTWGIGYCLRGPTGPTSDEL